MYVFLGRVRTLLEWTVGLLSKMLGDGWMDTPQTVMITRAPGVLIIRASQGMHIMHLIGT